MSGIPQTSRRTALAAAGATGVGLALAACGSDTGGQSVTDSGGGGGEAPAPPSGAKLTALDDVPVGGAVGVTGPDEKPLVVARTSQTEAVAFSAVCTHNGCTVKPAGNELHCPCHGSKFEAATGKVLGGPASSPLPSVPVQVQDGNVVTGKA